MARARYPGDAGVFALGCDVQDVVFDLFRPVKNDKLVTAKMKGRTDSRQWRRR